MSGRVLVSLINVAADRDAAVYVRARSCLDDARDLAQLVVKGTAIHITADDGSSFRALV